MRYRRQISLYRPIRPAIAPALTPQTAPDRLLWLDGSAGVSARGAVALNGANQHLFYPGPVVTSYPFTVAIWFKHSGADDVIWAQVSAVGGNHGNYIYCTAGTVGAYSDKRAGGYDAGAATVAYTTGQWHLLVAVWESDSSRKVSIDGGAFGTPNTTPVPGQEAPANMVVGATGTEGIGFNNHFEGNLQGLGVWGRALSSAEVAQLYNGGAGLDDRHFASGLASDLVSWHDLDEAAGIRNDSRGPYHLTAVNNPPVADGVVQGPADDHDPSQSWVDRIADHEFTEATVDNRPTYRSAGYLDFDGADDRLSRAGALVGDRSTFTLLAKGRVNALPSSGEAVIYCEEDATAGVQFRLAVTSTGAIAASYRPAGGPAASVTATAPMAVGQEAVIAVRRDASTLSLFLDGSPAGSGAIDSGADLSGALARIGAPVAATGGCLNGRIGQIFAMGRALSDTQIASLSNSIGS